MHHRRFYEDLAYESDHRVCAGRRAGRRRFDARRMMLTFEVPARLEDEEGVYEGDVDEDVELPARFVVCTTCEGHGTHVNPSIDANGITGDEWAQWDEEDRVSYLEGRYDVVCADCGGARVVPEIDEARADPATLERVQKQLEQTAHMDAIEAHERRMGY